MLSTNIKILLVHFFIKSVENFMCDFTFLLSIKQYLLGVAFLPNIS